MQCCCKGADYDRFFWLSIEEASLQKLPYPQEPGQIEDKRTTDSFSIDAEIVLCRRQPRRRLVDAMGDEEVVLFSPMGSMAWPSIELVVDLLPLLRLHGDQELIDRRSMSMSHKLELPIHVSHKGPNPLLDISGGRPS